MFDLEDYRSNVGQMFAQNSPVIITNRDRAHASILVETLVSVAQERILILCQNLCEKVYDSEAIVDEFKKALKRNVAIHILIQEKPKAQLLVILNDIFKAVGGTFNFRICEEGSDCINLPFNFMVVDGKSFRFEDDREACTASASANQPMLGVRMEEIFWHAWNNAGSKEPLLFADPELGI